MFCPECGSTDKDMINNICIDCFLKNFKIISIPDKLEVTICSHCNSKIQEGKWIDSYIPEEEVIYRVLEDNIKVNNLVENEEIELEINQMRGTIAECSIIAIGEVYGKTIQETHNVNIKINKTVCPNCSKRQSGYYEAVIQFRADDREITNKEYGKANGIINKTLNKLYKKDKLAYLSDFFKLKEGYDYYIGSYKSGKKVANALRKEFGGIIKESPRIISEDKSTGKGLYRFWISLRIPKFKINDFIKFNEKFIEVIEIDGSKIIGIDIESGKKKKIHWNDYNEIEFIKSKKEIEKASIISKSPKVIQILDPIDYATVDLEYDAYKKNYEIGDEIKFIRLNNRIYLLNK